MKKGIAIGILCMMALFCLGCGAADSKKAVSDESKVSVRAFPCAKDELHKAAYNGEAEKLPEGYKPYIAIALGYKKVPNGKAPARRAGTVNYVKAEGQNI